MGAASSTSAVTVAFRRANMATLLARFDRCASLIAPGKARQGKGRRSEARKGEGKKQRRGRKTEEIREEREEKRTTASCGGASSAFCLTVIVDITHGLRAQCFGTMLVGLRLSERHEVPALSFVVLLCGVRTGAQPFSATFLTALPLQSTALFTALFRRLFHCLATALPGPSLRPHHCLSQALPLLFFTAVPLRFKQLSTACSLHFHYIFLDLPLPCLLPFTAFLDLSLASHRLLPTAFARLA